MLAEAPWEIAVMSKMGKEFAEWLRPADVVDFIQHFPEVKDDICAAVILAVLKEPLATYQFINSMRALGPAASRGNASAGALHVALGHIMTSMDGCPNAHEVEQLARQGVSRFMGPASVARSLGVIRKTGGEKKKKTSSLTIKLGKTKQPYVVEDVPDKRIHEFCRRGCVLEDAWRRAKECTSLEEAAKILRSISASILKGHVLFPPGMDSDATRMHFFCIAAGHQYPVDFVTRKLLIGLLHTGSAIPQDWGNVSIDLLRDVSADASEYLELFRNKAGTKRVTAGELSELLLGTPTNAIYVSMWACLWRGVAKDRSKDDLAKIGRAMDDGTFQQLAHTLKDELGVTPHPDTVAAKLLDCGQKKRPR